MQRKRKEYKFECFDSFDVLKVVTEPTVESTYYSAPESLVNLTTTVFWVEL